MYVEKFMGETLEETLKQVKEKLGPDAIILKTVTNKGLKSALKKNKIEITAAISEKNYMKKANVDKVLSDDQRKNFYGGKAQNIKRSIDNYEQTNEKSPSYGSLGLNKIVNTISKTTKQTSNKLRVGLDEFLSGGEEPEISSGAEVKQFAPTPRSSEMYEFEDELVAHSSEAVSENSNIDLSEYETKIAILEQKIQDLMIKFEQNIVKSATPSASSSIEELRTTLRSLELSDAFIQEMIHKAKRNLSREQMDDHDLLFEYVLKEMAECINVGVPLFSSIDEASEPVITILMSEVASGQTSSAIKLASLKSDSTVISFGRKNNAESEYSFASNLFKFEIKHANTISEVYSLCRNELADGKSVFVDFRNDSDSKDETKQFVDGIKRAFSNIDIMLNLSAIHSELYNRKIISKYKELIDGTIISHIDLCLNYGAVLNLHYFSREIPIKFFGTGSVIPDDIEAASPERLLAGMFKF